jgi:4-amino-4-deoxy-L-arabinose transferase-like glycosyltransferase
MLAHSFRVTRTGAIFACILIAASVLRFYSAATRPLIGDENYLAIDLAHQINVTGDGQYLPVRGRDHAALPSYVIKLSFELFGINQLGYRALHVFLGLVSIAIVFRIAAMVSGNGPALWAAALIAFNEYHVVVSSLATAKGPHLFFVLLAIYGFTQLLITRRPRFFYASAAMLALAFYCKEHTVLLLLAFGLTLLHRDHRGWWRSRHLYLALLLFAAMVLPDLLANAHARAAGLETQGAAQATYLDHLTRIGGIGISPYPAMFFLRDSMAWVSAHVLHVPLTDQTPEYPAMNALIGLILLAAVVTRTFTTGPDRSRHLLIVFWTVFGFFSLIRPGVSLARIDSVTWYWTDAVMFPAAVMAGAFLATEGRVRAAAQALAVAGMIYAVLRMTALLEWPG